MVYLFDVNVCVCVCVLEVRTVAATTTELVLSALAVVYMFVCP